LVAFHNSTRVLRIGLSRETLPQGRWLIKRRLLPLRCTAVAVARPQRRRAAATTLASFGESPRIRRESVPDGAHVACALAMRSWTSKRRGALRDVRALLGADSDGCEAK